MMPRLLFSLALVAVAAPARAQLPDAVRAMIEAAFATGNAETLATVAAIARITQPEATAEIDALLASLAEQQAAPEPPPAPAEPEVAPAPASAQWSGRGQIGGFQSSGNTDAVGLTASLALTRQGTAWSHRLRAAADYQRTAGVTSREQLQLAWEPRYQLGPRWFAYGLAQYERDRFQGFTARYAVSGGVGVGLIASNVVQVSARAGPAWRRTDFIAGGSDDRLALLLGLDASWQLSESVKLTQNTSAMAETYGSALAVIDSANTTLNLVTGLEARISERFTSRLSHTVDYNSNPPPGALRTDTITRFTLVYDF